MYLKVIYEDQATYDLEQKIALLDTKQFYFLERFLLQEKQRRKQEIYNEWLITLSELTNNYKYTE
ncbi:MAG: hypothetical protein IKM15_06185 [Peptococcaceae bacterium]|nr:hypothetical protein [Peptococcaceae bacterium]